MHYKEVRFTCGNYLGTKRIAVYTDRNNIEREETAQVIWDDKQEIEIRVKELAEWLTNFHDQEAEVQIVDHFSGTSYYDQGGNAYQEFFNADFAYRICKLQGK